MGSPGHDGGDNQRRNQGHHRGQEENQLVGTGWHQFFLKNQLNGIGDGLQNAPRTGPIGANAHLDAGQCLALKERQVGKAAQKEQHQHDRLYNPFQYQRKRSSMTFLCSRRVSNAFGIHFCNYRCPNPQYPCCAVSAPRWPGPSRPAQPALPAPLTCSKSHWTPGIWLPRGGRITEVLPICCLSSSDVMTVTPRS